jgi:hypothetical protein
MTTVAPMTPPTMAFDGPEFELLVPDVDVGTAASVIIVLVPVEITGITVVRPSLRTVVLLDVKMPTLVNVVEVRRLVDVLEVWR